jgi:phenylacetate-CoA ligase
MRAIFSYVAYPIAERYLGRSIRPKAEELREWMRQSPAARRKTSQQRLARAVEKAGADVPYYRDLFRELQFDPKSLETAPQDFYKLPYLTKQILRDQGGRMLSDKVDHTQLHLRRTNGSTGFATEVYYDQQALDWSAATNLLTYDFSARKRWQTEIHLSTRFIEGIPPVAARIEWFKCLAMGRANIHTQEFTEEGLRQLLKEIADVGAYLIQGHPSTMYFLSLFVQRYGLDKYPLFEAFASTGETLDLGKANLISKVLGCRVLNRYGNAEVGVVAHSRENPGELEIFDFNVHVENAPDQELVITGLLNEAMPLLRYRTGDLGEVYEKVGLPFLRNLGGRIHDVVPIRGRMHPSHFVKDLLERWGGVDEWQIEIKKDSAPVLKIVGNAGLNPDLIRAKVSEFFGEDYQVVFVELSQLHLVGSREKFRYVVEC